MLYNVDFNPILSENSLAKEFCDIAILLPHSHGRWGQQYIFLVLDHFTKYIKLFPLARVTTEELLKCLQSSDYFRTVGIPKCIYSDNGSQFTCRTWKKTVSNLGIKTRKMSLYHACSNPSEQYFRQVKQFLSAYCHTNQKTSVDFLQGAKDQIILTYNETTKEIPLKAMFGQQENSDLRKIIKFPQSKTINDFQQLHDKIRQEVKKKGSTEG